MNSKKANLKKVKVLGIDLDGVVYQGHNLFLGVSKSLEQIISMGYSIEFLTNNSTRSSAETEKRLREFGVSLNNIHVINSIDTTIELVLRLKLSKNRRIQVIGSNSLKRAIKNLGYSLSDAAGSDYLIVGFTSDINYEMICSGVDAIHSGATFIACNTEANYPDGSGQLKPGCGAIVAAISVGSKHAPDYISGKPSTIMLEMLVAKYKCHPDEILVIGDTLESDIQMAQNFGSFSGWVSGKNKFKEISISPTFTISELVELPEILLKIQGS